LRYILPGKSGPAKGYKIREIGADPWNATQILQQLQEDDGFRVVEMRQGFASMSAPMKQLEALVMSQKLRHAGNAVLRWMFDNVSVKLDPAGNIKPDKEKSAERIDGVVALIMGVGRASLGKRAAPAPGIVLV
jgi:phage terminase large subunit-like protein